MLVPGDAFKERINKPNDDGGCNELRPKLGALGNAARNNGGNGSCKCEQEKELDQLVAIFVSQGLCADHEAGAIRHAIADHKISQRGHAKVHQDFYQRIDLVFFANSAEF